MKRIIATRPVALGWVGFFFCTCALLLLLILQTTSMVISGELLDFLLDNGRRGPHWLIYPALAILLPLAAPTAFRAVRALIDHGSAVIWIQDGFLYSSVHRPIPVADVASVEDGRGHSGMRVVRVRTRSGKTFSLGVGGMRPGAQDAAHELRGALGLIPPLS